MFVILCAEQANIKVPGLAFHMLHARRVGSQPQPTLPQPRGHGGKSNLKFWRDKRGRLKASLVKSRSYIYIVYVSYCTIACLPCWIQLRRCATAGNLECLGYGLALLCLLAWRKDLKGSWSMQRALLYLRGPRAEDVANPGNDMVNYLKR